MEHLSVAIADDNQRILDMLDDIIQTDKELDLVGKAKNGEEMCQIIKDRQPDVVLLDLIMPKMDGLTVMEQVNKQEFVDKRPYFIVLTAVGQEKITEDAFNKGANYYIMKPFNHTILLDRIKSIRKKPAVFEKKNEESIQEVSSRRENLESRVTNMLHEIGIPAHIKGYHYLRDAIMMAVNDMEYRKAFMKYVCRGEALPKEYRADAVSKSTDVGAVIPTTVLNQIVEKLESTGMILALVTRTAYKGGVSIPVSTVKPTATWVNEGAGSDKQKKNIAKDGMITFAYHKLRCAVAVSLEVDTMAISAFETLLINNIVEAMTKALEQAIIDGNGTGKPKGILAETPADRQTIESAAPSYSDLIKAEGALPMAYENGAVWCMSKKTFMEYVGMTDKNGQPIAKVNYGTSGKPERTLLGRTVVLCDYVASYSAALAKDTIFAFLFNFKDYVLNTNYSMGVKKYEDNDTDDQITKGIMLVDGKVVDKNSLVVVKKIEAV